MALAIYRVFYGAATLQTFLAWYGAHVLGMVIVGTTAEVTARYLAGDYPAAADCAAQAKELLWVISSFFEEAEYHFYAALTLADTGVCNPRAH